MNVFVCILSQPCKSSKPNTWNSW